MANTEHQSTTDIFISYSKGDKEWARTFAEAFVSHGWTVWWDQKIPPGQTWDTAIGARLEEAKCMVVLWSKAAIASNWVKNEARRGLHRSLLVPVFVEEVAPPLEFDHVESANLAHWDRSASDPEFKGLLEAIERLLKSSESAARTETTTQAVRPSSTSPTRRMPVWAKIVLPIAVVLAGVGGWAYFHRASSELIPDDERPSNKPPSTVSGTPSPAVATPTPSPPLTSVPFHVRSTIDEALDQFQNYMIGLGYKPTTAKVTVFVDPNEHENSYYEATTNRIVVGAPFAEDTDVVFREYTHHALIGSLGKWALDSTDNRFQGVESGLADYFACSFNNDPVFGEKSAVALQKLYGNEAMPNPWVRKLENGLKLSAINAETELHHAGEAWSGVFWDIRNELGQVDADALLFAAWKALAQGDLRMDFTTAFGKKILAVHKTLNAGKSEPELRAILVRRGLKL